MFRLAGQPTKLQLPGLYFPRFRDYSSLVTHTRPGNLVGYWPLDDASGTKVRDLSGNNNHGTATGVLWQQPGIGDGRACAYFDGAASAINVYSAGLVNQFSNCSGTIMTWGKLTSAVPWATGCGYLFRFRAGTSGWNSIIPNGNNSLLLSVTNTSFTYSTKRYDFFCTALTWTPGVVGARAYINGVCVNIYTITPVWQTISVAAIGCADGSPTTPWLGNIAHVACWSAELTPEEIYNLGPQALAGVP